MPQRTYTNVWGLNNGDECFWLISHDRLHVRTSKYGSALQVIKHHLAIMVIVRNHYYCYLLLTAS
jgi:hypothetical protein